ncbi:MAG: NAD-dependent dihydropyrimidine dehydrogenase subunit PreA [Bacteriovoracaceae bacterium]|nr:NAD-dependent dihydropyrimidine dehydrogenase subunit PreA [Bacteriovoracaceae bacterium]
MADLSTEILGIAFESPFLLASAPPAASIAGLEQAFSLGWSGAVLKTIVPADLEMREASPRYGFWWKNKQLLALQNIELLSHESIASWVEGIKYLKKRFPRKVLIASIMAQGKALAWQNLVQALEKAPLDAYELNFSCPHGMPEHGIGLAIGTSAEISQEITSWVKAVTARPVLVKLTAQVSDIVAISQAVLNAKADGLVAINTIPGFLGIDLKTLKPLLNIHGKTAVGGLSGPWLRPLGLRYVAQLRQNFAVPILGSGGISTWEDAAQYIAVGADAVQVCTAVMLHGYEIIQDLTQGLQDYLAQQGWASIADLKNIAVKKIVSHEALNREQILHPQIDLAKCSLCGHCVKICAHNGHSALAKAANKISCDERCCVGCGLCPQVCPSGAIKLAVSQN